MIVWSSQIFFACAVIDRLKKHLSRVFTKLNIHHQFSIIAHNLAHLDIPVLAVRYAGCLLYERSLLSSLSSYESLVA